MFDTIDALFFVDRYKKEIIAGMIGVAAGYQLISDLYFSKDEESKEVIKNVK